MSNPLFILMLAGSFVAGLLLGFMYFYGLWMTIKKLPSSKNPSLLALGSFFVRTLIVIAVVILLVRGGYWQNGIACVAGIIVMRIILVRKISFGTTIKGTTGNE